MFEFNCKFIKIDKETQEIDKAFEMPIPIADEDDYEFARACALNIAQGILRDLDGAWFMRLEIE